MNKKIENTKSSKEDQNQSASGKLSSKHEQRFKVLEGLTITDTQKSDIAKWRQKAEQGDKKALDKIENKFEEWKKIGEEYKEAHDAIAKTNIAKIHKEGSLKILDSVMSKATRDLVEKRNIFKSVINSFEANQKALETKIKGERGKAKKIWSEKIGKNNVFSVKERKAESDYWKKELTGKYLNGKDPNFTDTILFEKTTERLKHLDSEAKKRKEVTQERTNISEIFKSLSEKSADPKGHNSLGIADLLKRDFSNLDLGQRQALIEDIKRIANKKAKQKGATASEALDNFFKEQREYPKDPTERYNALEEQGLGISDWSDAKKHFESAIDEAKKDEDLSAKEKAKFIEKFEGHRDACDVALQVNSIEDAVSKDSNESVGLNWQDSLKAHQEHQNKLDALKGKDKTKNEMVENKIADLDERIQRNIQICEEEIAKEDEKNSNKPKSATEAADMILEGKVQLDNSDQADLDVLKLDTVAVAKSDQDYEEVGESEQISSQELLERRQENIAEEIQDSNDEHVEVVADDEEDLEKIKDKLETDNGKPAIKTDHINEDIVDLEDIENVDASEIDEDDVRVKVEDEKTVLEVSDDAQKQHQETKWDINKNITTNFEKDRSEMKQAIIDGDSIKIEDGKDRIVGEESAKESLREQGKNIFEGDEVMQQGVVLAIDRISKKSSSEVRELVENIGKNKYADDYEERKAA